VTVTLDVCRARISGSYALAAISVAVRDAIVQRRHANMPRMKPTKREKSLIDRAEDRFVLYQP
jgi:hypothetical protein